MEVVKDNRIDIVVEGHCHHHLHRNGNYFILEADGDNFSAELMVTQDEALDAMGADGIEFTISKGGIYEVESVDFDSGTMEFCSTFGRFTLTDLLPDVSVELFNGRLGWNISYKLK